MPKKLLQAKELDWSDTVANSTMNRERKATGTNSYTKDLGINPIVFIKKRLRQSNSTNWLDVCCGSGNALIETILYFHKNHPNVSLHLEGIDLVNFYNEIPAGINGVQFHTCALRNWKTEKRYDLLTCVHGLHYVGDKLAALEMLLPLLKKEGKFAANLDLESVRDSDNKSLHAQILAIWKEHGISYDKRNRIVSCIGPRTMFHSFSYQGADDKAGPNYTGQRAVRSYYSNETGSR